MPETSAPRCCVTCTYSFTEEGNRYCRRYPPMQFEKNGGTSFPPVFDSTVCGEHAFQLPG